MSRPRLTRAEMIRLIQRAQAEEPGAMDEACRANDRLVGRAVGPYVHIVEHMDIDDLMQSGRIGLVKAIRDYEPARGAWSTCAMIYVLNEVKRAMLSGDREIRVPGHVWIERRKGIVRPVANITRSLDDPIDASGDPDGNRLRDLLPGSDDTEAAALANIENGEKRAELLAVLAPLPEAERVATMLYFGLEDGEPRSLEQVGRLCGVTRECVRNRIGRAIRRIREKYRARGYTIDSDVVDLATP